MKISYEARLIKSTDDKHYLPAIGIYAATTPVAIKTSTNEIAYYINNPSRDEGRTMFFFALLCNNKVVGFAEIGYLIKTKTAFIDYMAFSDGEKKNSNFYPFLNIVIDSIINDGYEVNYIITEISDRNNGRDIDEESRFFSRLVALEDFMIIDAPYTHLRLGENTESEFECKLFVRIMGGSSVINKQTYLALIHDIYFSHYLTWFSSAENQALADSYKAYVTRIYDEIQNKLAIGDTPISLINKNTVTCEYYSSDGCLFAPSTAGSGAAAKTAKRNQWWVPLLVSIICFSVATGAYYLLTIFKLDTSIFIPLLAAITALCAAGIGYYAKR